MIDKLSDERQFTSVGTNAYHPKPYQGATKGIALENTRST